MGIYNHMCFWVAQIEARINKGIKGAFKATFHKCSCGSAAVGTKGVREVQSTEAWVQGEEVLAHGPSILLLGTEGCSLSPGLVVYVSHNLETPGELIDRMDGTLQARTKAWMTCLCSPSQRW